MSILKKKIIKLPNSPGVYQFFDSDGVLLYVGKAISLKKRVTSYFRTKSLGPKTDLLVKKTVDLKFIKVFSEFEALLLEANLIKQNQPFFNSVSKDDKSPIYIKITNGQIPLIQTARRPKKIRGEYVAGPFPSAKTTKEVLNLIRRIFPYCHHKNPGKPCLFVHLNLCPFPYKDDQNKKKYLKTIEKIKKLLSGKSKSLLGELTREMQTLSRAQKYEEANEIKKQIGNIEYVGTTYHAPREFLERPTLVDDLTLARLEDLKVVLNLEKLPRRIECYDISNIGGKLATGSMIVFENGVSQKSQYRRFKIKFHETPNDYQMIKQIISRRFKNNWKLPDLMIIDGGRGQLNNALKVVGDFKKDLQVISLAKRF